MSTLSEPVQAPVYMIDSNSNLIIEAGRVKLHLAPTDALALIKFVERTGYQAQANTLTKGAAQ